VLDDHRAQPVKLLLDGLGLGLGLASGRHPQRPLRASGTSSAIGAGQGSSPRSVQRTGSW
jgi:hypothetical protein